MYRQHTCQVVRPLIDSLLSCHVKLKAKDVSSLLYVWRRVDDAFGTTTMAETMC